MSEARTYVNRCINITHEMAFALICECRKRNVDTIVAPFEADAQLAFLNRNGIADYVITEDSDLPLFGCTKVIFKFDLNGDGLLFEADKLHEAMGCKPAKYTFEKFQMMCILSGCDYLDSLKGVGLMKACKFVLMTEETDLNRCLPKVPQYLGLKQITVDDEYILGFRQAFATFKHMIVYDPIKRKQCRLTEPDDETDLKVCCNAGTFLADDVAYQMAIGNLNPFTLKAMDDWSPSSLNTDKYPSIWSNEKGNAIIKVIGKKSQVSPKRRPLMACPSNNDSPKINTMDLMQRYLDDDNQGAGTSAKKLKMDDGKGTPVACPSNTPVRSGRNPFAKRTPGSDCGNDAGEVTMSLLKQVSPVKKIPSMFNRKLSKFKKTVIKNPDVKVVSRFFNKLEPQDEMKLDEDLEHVENAERDKSPDRIIIDDDDTTGAESSAPEQSLSQEDREKTPERQIVPHSEESPFYEAEAVYSSQKENEIISNSSQKENEVVVLSDSDSPAKIKKSTGKKKSIQSRLMAFGFKRK